MNSNEGSVAKKTPGREHSFAFKVAVIRQQFRNFARYLKFHWRALGPAPVTPHGFRLQGNRYMQTGVFEPEETALTERCLREADVFINVGANIGYYCLHALKLGRKTVAFEPNDLNVLHLLHNVHLNGWEEGFELFPLAMSDQTGILKIYGGGTGASLLSGWAGSQAFHSTLCPVARMDDVLGHRFAGKRCFILVDIEGAELAMLRGAQQLLNQNPRPIWLVEICKRGHNNALNPNFEPTFELFWAAGYSAWVAAKIPRRLEKQDLTSGDDALLVGSNFLFVAAGAEPAWFTAA
jgi:FkbM family methyltransferase